MATQSRSGRHRRSSQRRAARVARVLSFYLGALWAYVALVAIFSSGTLSQPLWHQLPGLRRDSAGALCFAGSFILYAIGHFIDSRP